MNIQAMKEKFINGGPSTDILYRVKVSGKTRFGGWRSYKKIKRTNKYIPWPWEMSQFPGVLGIEWKFVEGSQ